MIDTQEQFGSDMLAKYGTTAQAWSPIDQITVAWRVYVKAGHYTFSPWPWVKNGSPCTS